ncbi:MAG: hypothetical protein KA717_32685 [Woronichinia naegeliana WA131]|uniref:Transposase n=1 Tax=Woronichinia naegeliana WA131 TaxID=2824559 RepID=A0A977KUR2_9CYAN|nr:MAG: hypothetical protein KA717_32685 [Woronichinia naegeliana WA131]
MSTDFAERKMEVNDLSFDGIVHCLNEVIGKIDDPRSVSNATKYSLREAILGAFAAFFMQNESFLEYQRQLNSRCGRDNAQSLFGLEKIPTVEQIRNIVDGVAASSLFPLFGLIYQALRSMGFLKAYEILRGNLLVAMDGTNYYSSEKVNCPCCSTKTSKQGKVTYFHQALLPVIVSPDHESVFSLPPEFITPQDGSEKQDCEQNAAKRWISNHASLFAGQKITLLGDDLYSIGVNLSQNAYSQKISLKAGGSKSRLKKRLVYKKVSKKQMARQHPRRKGNPDLRRKTNQPGVEIPEITKELFELLEPTMFTPLKYLQGTHEKMMRDRVLNLPVMVALVLSIVYRQIAGISEAVRLLEGV